MTPTYRTTITQPPRPAVYGDWPTWAYPPLITQLADEYGITRPYQHQSLTATTAHDGRHVIVATGTSSGKSLGYQLPALTDLARDPAACALYLTPTKALGNDQLTAILRLCRADPALASINPAPYDGDTTTGTPLVVGSAVIMLVIGPVLLGTAVTFIILLSISLPASGELGNKIRLLLVCCPTACSVS